MHTSSLELEQLLKYK